MITPYLRGSDPTRFLSDDTLRDGRGVALAQDALELADALDLETFAVAGHDWGARVAYTLVALFPERVRAMAGIALAYQSRGLSPCRRSRRRGGSGINGSWRLTVAQAPSKPIRGGSLAYCGTPEARPAGFDEAEFEATARSFENPDWTAITLHACRSRWRPEPVETVMAAR